MYQMHFPRGMRWTTCEQLRGCVQVKITGFSEDDQTNLYNMAHDASGKGAPGPWDCQPP